jgi:hypothetical protein
MIVLISEYCGQFAENKDAAKEIRENYLIPAVLNKSEITIDFSEIDSSTQSFIHALISDIIQSEGVDSLQYLCFKNCNEAVKSLITTVVNYSME